MKIPRSIFSLVTQFPSKAIHTLIRVNLLVVGLVSIDVYANELIVLEDSDGDRFPDLFEQMHGTDDQSVEAFPVYPETQTAAGPKYFRVDNDFPEDTAYEKKTIQAALNAAKNDGNNHAIIEVLPGFYPEDIVIPSNLSVFLFANNSLELAQGSEHPYTIVDGVDEDPYGNAAPVLSIRAENVAIDGLRITGGEGQGIAVEADNVLIKSCEVYGNANGGIRPDWSESNIRIQDSKIYGNRGTGVWLGDGKNILIKSCEIYDNIAEYSGGGIEGGYENLSNVCIEDTRIYNNLARHGGGISLVSIWKVEIKNSSIYGNFAQQSGGGMILGGASDVDIINSLIFKNKADEKGGGIYFSNVSDCELINTTLFNNSANLGSEIGKSNYYGDSVDDIKITNSIVWSYNDLADIFDLKTYVSAKNSVIRGTTGYVNEGGVSNEDPRLTAQGLLTNHEVPTSSAIDQATTSELAIDIQDESRPYNNVSDIGADEFIDSDADGLPDFWVEQYFGNSTVDPIDSDTDDDLLTTLDEYVWGMDPSVKLFQEVSFAEQPLNDGDAIAAVGDLKVRLDNELVVSSVKFVVEDVSGQKVLSCTDDRAPFVLSLDATNITDSGNYTFRMFVFNHRGDSVEETRAVQIGTNKAPTIEPIGENAVVEGALFTYQVNATDSDGDDALLSYSISASPEVESAELEISSDGLISFDTSVQQDELAGRDFTITVTVTDSHPEEARFSTTSFNLRVREIIEFENKEIEAVIRTLLEIRAPDRIFETDMQSLSGNLDLSKLNLESIEDLVALKYATNITGLNLSENNITDLTPLSGLTQLVTLDLSNNQISEISALTGLTHLTTLNLGLNLLNLDAGDEDATIISQFVNGGTAVDSSEQARFTLDISVIGGGTVSVNPDQVDYGYADQVSLTATPTGENLFTGWSGAFVKTESEATYKVTANATVNAEFADGIAAGDGDGLLVDTYGYLNDPKPDFADSFNGPGYRTLLADKIYLTASPVKDITGRSTYFSGRLFGTLEARYSGPHKFEIPAKYYIDATVYLDGERILYYDNSTESDQKDISDLIDLVAGQIYTIEIYYRVSSLSSNWWNQRPFYVIWEFPDGTRENIPKSQLYSGYEFTMDAPAFASAVTAKYFDSDDNPIDISNAALEFGLGTLQVNSKIQLSAGEDEIIRYTLDGSEPDATASLYNRPITISGNTILRARAYSATAFEGAVFTGIYTVDEAKPVLSDLQLPDINALKEVSTNTIRVGDSSDRVISINVQDESAITDVRFYLTDVNTKDTVFLGADDQGTIEVSGARFETPFDIFNFKDGDWNLKIIATDFFGNETIFEKNVEIVMAPPEAPVIEQPFDNSGFADGQITISGNARIDCTVQVQSRLIDSTGNPLSGAAGIFTTVGSPVTVSSSGEFSLTHFFADNVNGEQYELRAVAIGRNNIVSPFTKTVKLLVDSSIPPAPVNLSVSAVTGGDILISWDAPLTYSGIIRLYRIQMSEDDGDSWMLVNEVSGDTNTYLYEHSDQTGSPPYMFRVLAVNAANIATLASEAPVTASIVPDETTPQITQFKWIPQDVGQFDVNDPKYGPGLLTVQIEVSEAVSETPYFALVPPGPGVPYKVDLIAITDRSFEGAVAIETGMPSGDYKAFAVLSDLAGNQSRSDDPENFPFLDTLDTTLTIDLNAPEVTNLNPAGQSTFKNDGATLSYTFDFDETLLEGSVPIASAEWGNGASVNASDIVLQELGTGSYQVTLSLGLEDGYDGSHPDPNPDIEHSRVAQSMLTVLLEVEDSVGNRGSAEIPSVLVYRNALPRPAPPTLHASVLPEGKILLEWDDVTNADRYQLMRVDSSEDKILATVPRDSRDSTTYEYTYASPVDGTYSFYVFGEREDLLNPGTFITGYSLSPVTAVTDSAAPEPAHTVEIEDANPKNPNATLRLDWQHPSTADVDHFDVYRTDTNPAGATEVNPSWILIREDIVPQQKYTFDSQPFAGQAWYIVVSSDALGNESLALNFPTSDISIVPPAEVKISLAENKFPVLSWTALDAITNSAEGSYSVYQGASGPDVLLATGLTSLEFTDTTWDGKPRTYWIESVKGEFRAMRNIVLPDYTLNLRAETTLYRGLPTPVKLNKTPDISWNYRVHLSKKGNDDTSVVYSGELNKPFVDFGLNADGSDAESQDVVMQLETWPKSFKDFGESVWFEVERSLPVENRLPVLSLVSDAVSRGATASNIELSIDNPSESDLKVRFSDGHVMLKLYDLGGNLLSQTSLTKEADRTILGEDSLTIEFLEIEIPENAPNKVILQAELSEYSNPQTGQSFTPTKPITTRLRLSTVELSYTAEITAPKADEAVSLLTGESIEITGRAVDRNGSPRTAALVTLGLENGDYKRTFSLVTDSRGEFKYIFNPSAAEPGGVYTVWAKHPELARTPDASEATGTFTYKRIAVSPEYHTVRIPRNYTQGVPITVTWPEDTTLSDFTVETVTFNGEDLPKGLSVTVPSVANPIEDQTTLEIIPQILPLVEAGAPNEANLLFRVSAKIEGAAETTVLGEVPVYCYFSQTFGQLTGPSKIINLSVLRETDGDSTSAIQNDTASFSFTNTGLISLTGLQFDVMQKVLRDGSTVGYEPAPKWLKLTSASKNVLQVGKAIELQLTTDLDAQSKESLPSNGIYGDYVVLAKSKEASPVTAAIQLNVTSDSSSGFEVHVINAYFGFDASKLPDGGSSISIPSETLQTYQNGVPGAKITLQQDDLQTAINNTGWAMPLIYKGITGKDGKVSEWTNRVTGETSSSIPSGRYQITVEASKHNTYKGVAVIKPGITGFEQIPLSYGAVTVEWEVREITLQDRYEVTTETIFETNVPAPVVTITPDQIALPNMCPGDVYEVELIVENHGIISALDLKNPIPKSDEYLQIEPLVELGKTFDLPAQQSRRIAYRCICIKALSGSKCN